MSVGRTPQTVGAGSQDGRKKVDRIKRMLLEDGLKEMEG
jgi:hypothetical protein